MTVDQAKGLGDKVTLTKGSKLEKLTVPELKDKAKDKGVEGYSEMNKPDLITALSEEE